ncbi:MAG: hypothetical protein WCV63_10945 [Negativicutes bacterium]|jgi:hypothetical protein
MRRALLVVFFTLLLFSITVPAISTDSIEQTLRDHEKRLATQEERGRRSEIELSRIDDWYDNRINNMEKYYGAKIEQQEKIDTELLATIDAAKTFIAFFAGITSLFFGWLGVRNIMKKQRS